MVQVYAHSSAGKNAGYAFIEFADPNLAQKVLVVLTASSHPMAYRILIMPCFMSGDRGDERIQVIR